MYRQLNLGQTIIWGRFSGNLLGEIARHPVRRLKGQLGHDNDPVVWHDDLGGFAAGLPLEDARFREFQFGLEMSEEVKRLGATTRGLLDLGLHGKGVIFAWEESEGEEEEEDDKEWEDGAEATGEAH